MRSEPLAYSDPIHERLDPGEVVHWTGQPRQGIFFRTSDLITVPFSLFWGGFAIVWETIALRSAWSKKAPLFVSIVFPLWGVPFVLIGLYMIFGRFFVDAYVRRRTWYALTDRRALIVTGLFTRTTVSLPLAALPRIELAEHRDGTGTIAFGQSALFTAMGRRSNPFSTRNGVPPAFDHIACANDVYRLAQQLRHPPVAIPAQA